MCLAVITSLQIFWPALCLSGIELKLWQIKNDQKFVVMPGFCMSFFAVGSWFKFKKRHVKIEHRNKRLAFLILTGFYWSLFFLRRVLPRVLPLLSNREPPGTLIDPERVFLPPCGPIACKKSAWEPGVADERLSSLPKN